MSDGERHNEENPTASAAGEHDAPKLYQSRMLLVWCESIGGT
jgi:hypothetical protein